MAVFDFLGINYLKRIRRHFQKIDALHERFDSIQQAVGRIEARQIAAEPQGIMLSSVEFQVSSQWGEDGIIEFLVRNSVVESRIFVEFGVEDYTESNTRFLLRNRNWSGLVIDGSHSNIQRIKRDSIYWRHNLKAEAAFITRENINALISAQGISGDIGLLSIDLDGNDYWVWDAITGISPRIVVVEYNAAFGPDSLVSIPYSVDFHRSSAHYSGLYWGCSLGALAHLGAKRGYLLIGCNSAGSNAFFVRCDAAGKLVGRTAKQAFVPSTFRDSRSPDGQLTYLSNSAARAEISHMEVVDVINGERIRISDIPATELSY